MRQFRIEFARFETGDVLVTLQDGPQPRVGDWLQDEGGHIWVVEETRKSEVLLRTPITVPRGSAPKGASLLYKLQHLPINRLAATA